MSLNNPLLAVKECGQSIWIDYIRRDLIKSGELARLIEYDGITGLTSNPAIFEKGIATSREYDSSLNSLFFQPEMDIETIYEELAIKDIQDAADLFQRVYESTNKLDGYVSLEVSPKLAMDEQGTVREARKLWNRVARNNLMIKVPGTSEGISAVKTLIAEGINVNITLLFSEKVYERVAFAFIEGLEARRGAGQDIHSIASVASFFISRIDAMVEAKVEGVAIANAKVTYQRSKEIFSGSRWDILAKAGAQQQRLLWASTSTKNPKYRDVLYVEELIGKGTVNTVPPATLDAFRDRGVVASKLDSGLDAASKLMAGLKGKGIDFEKVTSALLTQGIKLFADSFDKLLAAISEKQELNRVSHMWAGDSTIWTGADEAQWLGWLHVVDQERAKVGELKAFAAEIKNAGFRDVVLLGMGGSSLAPWVMLNSIPRESGFPNFHVLGSIVPAQVLALEKEIDLKHTLFIVSSKSGKTIETSMLCDYFLTKVDGQNFIAITDENSELDKKAQKSFRKVFHGVNSIGGRYSALSHFGMVPAALMGVDVERLLNRAKQMVENCLPDVSLEKNPGAILGIKLGEMAKIGRDKVTFVASPKVGYFVAWLEQLIAESTGKDGKGLIPIIEEPLGQMDVYGNDRLFVSMKTKDETDPMDLSLLRAQGSRLADETIQIELDDVYDIGGEFFKWEIATAIAASIVKVNPFDQPDVEASKQAAKSNLSFPRRQESRLSPLNLDPRLHGNGEFEKGSELLSLFASIVPGDYFNILAFVEMNWQNYSLLQQARVLIRDTKKVATTVSFGPQYLHSSGQLHKGGPQNGLFLFVTFNDAMDISIPAHPNSFGTMLDAQVMGDISVLKSRGQRVMQWRISGDLELGLKQLIEVIKCNLE